jgi:RimJ/RimL family protein N-acetyltransferase
LKTTLQLATPRLILRPWQDRDRAPFAAMNADPAVMTYFAAPMTPEESNAAIDRYILQLDRDGFTMLAAEHRETGDFAGVIGMQTMRDVVPNLTQPAIEVGWRLALEHHGKGLATEGAQAVIDHAFTELHLPEIVAVTAKSNAASRRVMEKLNMTHRPDLDFDHPRIPAGHPHQRHAVYSLSSTPYFLRHSCSTPS